MTLNFMKFHTRNQNSEEEHLEPGSEIGEIRKRRSMPFVDCPLSAAIKGI